MTLKHLVLFDIDGTLLWPDGAGRASMRAALQRVYGTAGPIEHYSFEGRTDREVVRDLMGAAGLPPEAIWPRFEQLAEVMTAEIERRVAAGEHHIRPCPGGHALVQALAARHDVLIGLLTGNLRPVAPVKLEAAGYDPELFRVGAYGDESALRADLAANAVQAARQVTGVAFHGEQIVIIGDTPADIICGRALGARSIAVLTGGFGRSQLEAEHPSYIFDDLTSIQAVIAAITAP